MFVTNKEKKGLLDLASRIGAGGGRAAHGRRHRGVPTSWPELFDEPITGR